MHLIDEKRARIAELCRQHGVRRLALFGSAVTGSFDPSHSDLDFLVEFSPMPPPAHAKSYFELLRELEELFTTKVDLVEAAAIRNPYILREVERTHETVYAA